MSLEEKNIEYKQCSKSWEVTMEIHHLIHASRHCLYAQLKNKYNRNYFEFMLWILKSMQP